MNQFRTSFPAVNRELLNWFPGHMGKGLKQMQQKLKQVDCVIEVHDARIPLSGRNSEFRYTVSGVKPHILVLNKKDLIEKRLQSKIVERFQQRNDDTKHVLFTNCKNQSCDGIRNVMPLAQDLILNTNRFNRVDQKEFCIMIIGVPNVGKSSLINVLRNRHLSRKAASQVGAIAGITRSVLNKIKICEEPLVYLLDTPGILKPNIADTETGLRLALVSCLQDHLVGEELIADYLLYLMNKRENFKYVETMGLKEPTDSIAEVLIAGAQHLNRTIRVRHYDGSIVIRPDVILAARHMIKSFRTGEFGKILIDEDKTR
ncbi:mitochondrial GTPase 1 [Toxorhynchites rutilus septentrionalis]|uniref:mitochondrial GTPase 1 n=1 Tax=Toxorhynchites rutilus septentrionalis TaxID=329112 RepID=UPI00247A33ED|nr:mitochondrial GTPase 1 [Toxorhynchites rutilus septentrionalis]